MSSATARFQLPFILPGQAQKELYHNEALARLDAVLHPAIETGPLSTPPPEPSDGQCWLVATGAGGAWAGKDGCLAAWTDEGWRFAAPVAGMMVWNKAAGHFIHYESGQWDSGALPVASLRIGGVQVVGPRQPSVPSPSGGTIIDVEARTAIDRVIETLMSHGLIG